MIAIDEANGSDIQGILEIQNAVILNTTASWRVDPAEIGGVRDWWQSRRDGGFPVLVARESDSTSSDFARGADAGGEVLAFGSFGPWRQGEGYRFTVENSVHVREGARGRGIGGLLLGELVVRARSMGLHVMVAGIESGNSASIRLHARAGFREVGRVAEAGTKFGRWLDLTLMQLDLSREPPPDA